MKQILTIIFIQLILALAIGCKKEDTTTNPGPTITPITDDLFPLVTGHRFVYTGFLVYPNTEDSAVTASIGAYTAIWTVLPGPSDTWIILDSTTVGLTTTVRPFQI